MAGPRRSVEGPRAGDGAAVNAPAQLPHRTATTENFPVASWLIAPRHRAAILAFYRFARTADDIADGPGGGGAKLAALEAMRATLTGEATASPEALALREAQAERGLGDTHGLDLLAAFRRDVTDPHVASWDDLIGYCRVSAMPVGRFVLDVHGERPATWAASDALCAALQVINHLQDCGEDYRDLARVYVPADWLAEAGIDATALGAARTSPALRGVLDRMLDGTDALLRQSRGFAGQIADRRLACEVAVIQRLAESLSQRLRRQDPLAGPVKHHKLEAAGLSLAAVARTLIR